MEIIHFKRGFKTDCSFLSEFCNLAANVKLPEMAESVHRYRESLFQWIWKELQFNSRSMATVCGKSLEIIDPGVLNHGAGPDFERAHLIIGGLHWHGSVEIHKTPAGWKSHQHHKDENFNNVVLHVTYTGQKSSQTERKDGTKPFGLALKPYLHKSLQTLLTVKMKDSLPCGGNVTFVNQSAFERQADIAHQEYFEYKMEEILGDYNPHLPVSRAWKQAVIIRLYSSLGIPSNRTQMEALARRLAAKEPVEQSLEEFTDLAEQEAQRLAEVESSMVWHHSGMRPASRPDVRIPQAAALQYQIGRIPLKNFLNQGPVLWPSLVSSVPGALRPGASRLSILKNTVFLPGLYLLGDLFRSDMLLKKTYSEWRSSAQIVPAEVLIPFRNAGYAIPAHIKKLGLAHQYKRYCKKRNCHHCEVFKNAIRS